MWSFKRLDPSKLAVITMISNPAMYGSRYALYRRFEAQMKRAGVQLFTHEVAFGGRHFEVTQDQHPWHLQTRCDDFVWIKERAFNLAAWRLLQTKPEIEYILFCDADIEFVYEDWAEKILHQLQVNDVVQPFSHAIDLDAKDGVIKVQTGYVFNYWNNTPERPGKSSYYYSSGPFYGHPGYCMAIRTEALRHLGSLIDWAIAGSGDHHMMAGLLGLIESTYPSTVHANYKTLCLRWQERALRYLKKNVGYVHGAINHYAHGAKAKRFYRERWAMLTQPGRPFDPLVDVYADEQGMWKLNPENIELRDDLRRYFFSRDEDNRGLDQ